MSTSVSSSPEQAAQPREAAELEALLAPLMLPAYRLAFGMLRNREEAEDAVQEAALSAWKHRKTFRPGADPKPWFLPLSPTAVAALGGIDGAGFFDKQIRLLSQDRHPTWRQIWTCVEP